MMIQTFFCSGNGFGPEGGGAVVDAMKKKNSGLFADANFFAIMILATSGILTPLDISG